MALPSILYWEEPLQTGAVFGPVVVVLLSLAAYSLISVVSYTCLTLLMTVLGVKVYSTVMVMMNKTEPGSDTMAKVAAVTVTIPPETISQMLPCVVETLNKVTTELRRLLLLENMVDTLKFTASLYMLTYIGSCFNMLTLVILAWISLFSAPKLYLENQEKVDKVLGQMMDQLEEAKSKVLSLIPIKAMAALHKNEE